MSQPFTARAWLRALDAPSSAFHRRLQDTYGVNVDLLRERIALIRRVISTFLVRFGGHPVRVFRAPGRINLRGMHVDTHGGWLNLMTHDREVIVAASSSADGIASFANIDQHFSDVSFPLREQSGHPAFAKDWHTFITHPDIQRSVRAKGGHWSNYLRGSVLNAQHRLRGTPFRGIRAVVGSDIPTGAALSSSAALCTALVSAILALNDLELTQGDLIFAARDAEWYTGSRCGISDQAAITLGGRDELLNVALLASDFDTSTARRMTFPSELCVLVINSFTQRSLSGDHIVEYTRNRFAYSSAMDIVRRELAALGASDATVERMDRLSAMSAEALNAAIGDGAVYRLLRRIPEEVDIAELRERYALPDLDAAYDRHFGTVPPEKRPTRIGLRGPLMFGIAESERARLFPSALESGDFEQAGHLMTIGHNGDRRLNADGSPYHYDVSDAALKCLATAATPIHQCPGAYGASCAALDAIVDAALEAGALGACLTGAGMAGVVLALCRVEDVDAVAERVRARLAAPDYAVLTKRETPISKEELDGAVVANQATASAGELVLT